MDKATLRKEIAAQKRNLSSVQIESASRRLAEQLFSHPLYQSCSTLYAYLSYNQEVRTEPILQRAWAEGKTVAVPKIFGEKMRFVYLEPHSPVASGYKGIPEPVEDLFAHCTEALVLTPGLAFDEAGNRLGYGGGFYDRFFAAEPKHPKIALCYDFQKLPALPTQEKDCPVDVVLSAPVTVPLQAVCEYNREGCLIYAGNFPGAYVRGRTEEEAMAKWPGELQSYLRWCNGSTVRLPPDGKICQRKESPLAVCDADSDVLFHSERQALTLGDYERLKLLVLRSARDFRRLYESIPNPDISHRPHRQSFYGPVPRTPREMYEHTNQVTAYYTAAFGLDTENVRDIYANRMQALAELESLPDFLSDRVYTAPDGELWTLRKVLRRFLWHDRIHAKAMWRSAKELWGDSIANPFFFVG